MVIVAPAITMDLLWTYVPELRGLIFYELPILLISDLFNWNSSWAFDGAKLLIFLRNLISRCITELGPRLICISVCVYWLKDQPCIFVFKSFFFAFYCYRHAYTQHTRRIDGSPFTCNIECASWNKLKLKSC